MSATKCSSLGNIVIHLLDIQARDMRIESEEEDSRKIAYESNSESDDDDEIKSRRKKKHNVQNYTQTKEFVIHLFGADETGRSIRCDVTGFRPTLYLRLPEDKTSQCADAVKQYINSQGIPMSQLNIKRVMKKAFYGFTANTFFPFLQIDVPSLTMFRNLRSLFLDENLNPKTRKPLDGPIRGKTIEVFEANIDPMLRFIHTQGIQPCGWVSIKDGANSITEDSETGIVIECDYEQVVPTKGPRVSAPFLTASWDIECFSMTGDFPLAKRTWTKTAKDLINLALDAPHAANLIVNSIATGQNPPTTLPKGMTPIYCQLKKSFDSVSSKLLESSVQEHIQDILKTHGDNDNRVSTLEKILDRNLKTLIYLVGDPVIQIGTTLTRGTTDSIERHLFVFPDCAPCEGIIIHAYKTEKAMILAWFEWMVQRNPDILLGYNIFGFDESYLWYRAEELNLITSTSPIHQFTRLFVLASEMKLEEKFLSSSALGDNRMYIWTSHGRLQIDLYHYIKRNNVLSSYKLDEVTKHFMSGKLKSQEYVSGKLTLTVAGAIKDVKVGRAVTLLDDTGETVSPKMTVEAIDGNKIVFNYELTEDELAEMEDATKWVVVKDDVSPQDIFRLHREGAKGRAIVGKYCLPEDEHQILTNRGYMYLHELLQLWGDDIDSPPATTDLLLAGFNTDTKQLVYERPRRLILNDYCVNQDMVEFTQHTYSDRWEKDNIFGLTEQQRCNIKDVEKDNTEYRVPNFVSLITTPEHDMYARCGYVTGNKNQYPRMTTGKDRIPIPFEKIKSKDLIGNGTPKIIKLMGRAENGIITDETRSIPYPFTADCELNITTREQQLAFLELYGYWLGDGSILIKHEKPVAITFNIVKKSDVEWLKNTFRILCINEWSLYKNAKVYENPDTSDGKYKIKRQSQYIIKIFNAAYKKFFFDEYLVKYIKTDTVSNRVKDFADVAKMINKNIYTSIINTDTSYHVSDNTEIEEIKSAKWMMKWVWNISKESSRAIINGIVLADGSHHKGKALKHIFTSSTRFRDEIERLAFHAGYSPYSTVCYLAGSIRGYSSDGKPVTANHTLWTINFPENEQFSEPTLKREENDIKYIKYTGRTWCVSMPSTFIVTRRARCVNGIVSHASRPLIIGNCLQDCDLVIELYKKLETFNNTMCMANVCSVPVSYIFTRGQGIKIESLIFKACRERDILIPVLSVPKQGINEDSYEGAIVLNPDPGFYSESPIGVCDFASLYPSTIVSENISHDSLLWIKDFKYDGTLISHNWGSELYDNCEGYAYTDIEFDVWRPDPNDTRKHPVKIKCGRRICRYAQPLDGTKSTLPQITTWLLQAREAKKKEMKGEKDPERYALLDAEQLAYKLTGNSLYGQLGSGTFKIRLQALAASVTAYGRKQILFAKEAIEIFYGPAANRVNCTAKVVYGDTDSLFVAFNPKNLETGERLEGREARQATIDITDEAGHFITKVLAAPHDFEFDKAFDPMLMFSKKRYAGNMYENNADDYVHKYMGIALKRRDNAPIVKTIFGGAMKMLLDKRDVGGAFKFVKDKCLELVEGKVSLGQLTVTKSLRADYANPQSIAHKVLADRIAQRDPGNAPTAGERIGYVYISAKSGQEASKLQGDRIETPLYVKDNNLIPDYRHYIEHQLQNPISQAFGLLLEKIPGFTLALINGCPNKPDIMDGSLEADKMLDAWLGFREAVAARLLFGDCLKKFENSSRQNAIINMFGKGTILTTPGSTVKRMPKKDIDNNIDTTKPIQVQKSISSFLLDKMIIGDIKKKERASKKTKEHK